MTSRLTSLSVTYRPSSPVCNGILNMGTNGFSAEPSVRAFCSYVHRDNENFGTAVERLVEDIRALHEAETGRTLQIFFDRTDIGWGQDFRNAISDSVENATFFIPFITARYFQSEYCRD